MKEWQQGFSRKMHTLREQWAHRFEAVAEEAIEPVFREFTEFVQQCDFHPSAPQAKEGLRSFKFALSEEAYVLVLFRSSGIDGVSCHYEYCVPGEGMHDGVRTDASLASANDAWVQRCFQMALDEFVGKLAQSEKLKLEELALV